jgi:hypothetical protein
MRFHPSRISCFFALAWLLLSSPHAHAGSPSGFGTLLLELEQQTKLASQYPSWPEKREAWRTAVRNATSVQALKEPLIEFEISIKSEAQGGTWSTRRLAWINEVRAAQTLNTLVDLLVEFETPIQWEALEGGWRTRRTGWYNEVIALKNVPASTSAATPSGVPSGSATEFGRLLRRGPPLNSHRGPRIAWLGSPPRNRRLPFRNSPVHSPSLESPSSGRTCPKDGSLASARSRTATFRRDGCAMSGRQLISIHWSTF